MKMRALIQAITTIVLAVVCAVGLQIGQANADDKIEIESRIEPTHWYQVLPNQTSATTPNLPGTTAMVTLQNVSPGTAPAISAVITSTAPSCQKTLAVGAVSESFSCTPGSGTITTRNNNPGPGASFLRVDVVNF